MSEIKVIPNPKEVRSEKGEFVLNDKTRILLGRAHTREDEFSAKLLRKGKIESFAKISLPIKVFSASEKLENVIILSIFDRDEEFRSIFRWQDALFDERLKEEGYILSITSGRVFIAARTEAGLFYGVQTLRQLIEEKEGRLRIPCLWIRDWPSIRYRGVMQDISRGQVLTMESFKKLIRTLSYFKMNLLSFYIEHTFSFEKHPLIGRGCGSLTREEIRELEEYAKDYHVELVPSFQALGHFHQILKHKEYAHLAETELRWSLSPAEEESYKLLEELFSEIVPAFSSKFFNIGCDEVWDLGRGKSRKMAEEMGKGKLYLSHILRVKKMLDKYGKTTMLWGDMLLHYPEIIPELPKDIVVMNWHYGSKRLENEDYYRPFIEAFQKAALNQFACTGTSSWLRLFPDLRIANRNIRCFISEAHRYGVKGVLNTNWGDDGNYNLLGYSWYGFCFSAEASWSPEKLDERTFDERFCRQFFGQDTEELSQVFWLLSQVNYVVDIDLPEEYPSWAFLLFWDDPFQGKYSTKVREPSETGRRLMQISSSALKIIFRAEKRVSKNKKWLDDLSFAARQIGHLGERLLLIEEVKRSYRRAYLNLEDEKVVTGSLDEAITSLKRLKKSLIELKDEYQRLWLRENRKPGLEYNLKRYEKLLKCYDEKIFELEEIKKAYMEPGGSLPKKEWAGINDRK